MSESESHPAPIRREPRLGWYGAVLFLVLSICLVGCSNRFFDPTDIGRFRPVPAVNVILDSLGVAEETPSAWEGAEEPRPVDVMAFETDYVFSPGDVVRVFIFELLREGERFINDYVVTESGRISIPDVGVVEAAGLTEAQLEEELRQILEPSILKEPSVSVTLVSSQQHSVSILGNGVSAPGRYFIPRYDFRLSDAIATAGGIREFNVSYIYVSRSVTGKEAVADSIERGADERHKRGEELITPEQELLEIIAPRAKKSWPGTKPPDAGLVIASAEMVTEKELKRITGSEHAGIGVMEKPGSFAEPANRETTNKWGFEHDKSDLVVQPVETQNEGRVEWIFQSGKWVPVRVGEAVPTEPMVKVEPEEEAEPLRERVPEDFGWDEIGTGGAQTRVIKIPVDRFQAADPRYNIAIRPGDTIYVPVDIIGEFYIMGNVNSKGAIPLTGRPMTLMQAIAAAGDLGPLAWPKRCEVRRRLGKNREEIVMVDLDKIAQGKQPDFFIKVNDLIIMGTHPTARWRAILRNAFRATYGFGFIYDRNFADRDYYTRRPIPNWF